MFGDECLPLSIIIVSSNLQTNPVGHESFTAQDYGWNGTNSVPDKMVKLMQFDERRNDVRIASGFPLFITIICSQPGPFLNPGP